MQIYDIFLNTNTRIYDFFREVTFIFRKVLFFHATHHAYIDGHFPITNAGLCPCITWDNEAIGRYKPTCSPHCWQKDCEELCHGEKTSVEDERFC